MKCSCTVLEQVSFFLNVFRVYFSNNYFHLNIQSSTDDLPECNRNLNFSKRHCNNMQKIKFRLHTHVLQLFLKVKVSVQMCK